MNISVHTDKLQLIFPVLFDVFKSLVANLVFKIILYYYMVLCCSAQKKFKAKAAAMSRMGAKILKDSQLKDVVDLGIDVLMELGKRSQYMDMKLLVLPKLSMKYH